MATIKSEMPPLHAAETTATALSSMGSGSVNSVSGNSSGNGNGGGTNGTAGNASNATTNSSTSSTSGANTAVSVNNTISAAADSSDNQPSTPQPQTQQIGVNEQQQQQQQQQTTSSSGVGWFSTTSPTTSGPLPHMYAGGIYASSAGNNGDMQQPQQQQHAYPSYINSYEQFYQQQGQTHSSNNNGGGSGTGPSGLDYPSSLYGSGTSGDYKASSVAGGVRYHPYLQTPTSNGTGSSGGNGNSEVHDAAAGSVISGGITLSGNGSNSGAVSTTTALSPRVVSSSSPTSTSTQLHMGNNNSGGSVNTQSEQLLCKKCGIMCTNETELQEHITNVHGASPYGSSGYSSSPYIKEEITGVPAPQPPQQQQTGGNPGDILDLDSQKMVYPPIPGSMQSIMGHGGLHHQQHHHHSMHDSLVNDPLHSMHSMQQRALPGWEQASGNGGQEGLPSYMQQTDLTPKPNQSPYYSPKQSPYHTTGGSVAIKQEFPLIKSEYADSQNYVDKSFDPTVASATDMCQQQASNVQQSMLPVSSSPAEFPSTTTGPQHEQQQTYRGFEPPTSSSVLPANSITAKAASWKSNEARRPKTYNCTACNKWFTSSGHLKRHYNTTLHKNAVKTSGQPDPATLPISAHHHPARDPNSKHSRRSGNSNNSAAAAAAAQQQKPPAPVQPPEPPRSPPDYVSQAAVIGGNGATGLGPMSHYSTSPSPTQQQQSSGGMSFGQPNGYQQQSSYLSQVQSTTNSSPNAISAGSQQSQTQSGTVLNGHPNGLAGPSAPMPTTTAATPTLLMPSSHTRGLLNTTPTTTAIITKREPIAEEDINNTTSSSIITIHSPMDMAMMDKELRTSAVADEAAEVEAELVAMEVQPHHQLLVKQELSELDPEFHLLHQRPPPYHNSTPNREQSPLIISHQHYQEQLHHQQQQQQQLLQQEMVEDNTFSQQQQPVHMLPQPLQLQANTMEAYNIIPLDINTQQQHSNNMQLLQPLQHTTNTTATTANMLDNIPMQQQHNLLRLLPQQEEQQVERVHNTLSNTTITSMRDTQQRINTTITPLRPHMPMLLPQLQHSTTNPTIPSFQQQQQPEAQLQLEHTMTYHTIIGNNDSGCSGNNSSSSSANEGNNITNNNVENGNGGLMPLNSYNQFTGAPILTTNGGQIMQLLSNGGIQPTYYTAYPTRTGDVAESYVRSYSSSTQRSPQEADLPPMSTLRNGYAQRPQESETMSPEVPFSPTVSSSTAIESGCVNMIEDYQTPTTITFKEDGNLVTEIQKTQTKRRAKRNSPTKAQNSTKRKRGSLNNTAINASTASTAMVLPSGRIKCIDCDKEFTKVCYLTQHNKCFHSGEYPFRCEKCGKRFQTEDVFTAHLERHKTQDKPHKCELCPKQFHHKTDLRRHIEAIHTGNKQHTCTICEKSFCRKDHLRKHIETHSRPRVTSRKSAGRASTSRRAADKKEANDALKAKFENIDSEFQQQVDSVPQTIQNDCAALDVLVVIKNECDLPSILEDHENCMNIQSFGELHDGMEVGDDCPLDEVDEEQMLMHGLPHLQQLTKSHQSMLVYVNE